MQTSYFSREIDRAGDGRWWAWSLFRRRVCLPQDGTGILYGARHSSLFSGMISDAGRARGRGSVHNVWVLELAADHHAARPDCRDQRRPGASSRPTAPSKIGKKAIMRREYHYRRRRRSGSVIGAVALLLRPCPSRSVHVHEQVRHSGDPILVIPKVTTGPLPASHKLYSPAPGFAGLRVPIARSRSTRAGEPPMSVYDTTGPYTDPDVTIDVEKDLRAPASPWVKERCGNAEYEAAR